MWTGIPVFKLTEAETQKLMRMEDELHKRVIGQHPAIEVISKAIRRSRAGLKDPKRPTGSFIFLGPSGVGKTELARTLAEFLFGDDDAMIRIDMSEYMEKHAVSRLVGSPPGYIGYDEGGQLTEAVRRKPYSVLLLDEIEKAHPDVFNILLQILEDGRLTDAQGRTVDFRHAIVIMTSNIGAAEIARNTPLGFAVSDDETGITYDDMKNRIMGELKKVFRPEFLNRIDDVIVFHKLQKEEIKQIVELLLLRIRESMAERELQLELTEPAKDLLVEKGWDPSMGARPLRRAIQRYIEDPLADFVLREQLTPGRDRRGRPRARGRGGRGAPDDRQAQEAEDARRRRRRRRRRREEPELAEGEDGRRHEHAASLGFARGAVGGASALREPSPRARVGWRQWPATRSSTSAPSAAFKHAAVARPVPGLRAPGTRSSRSACRRAGVARRARGAWRRLGRTLRAPHRRRAGERVALRARCARSAATAAQRLSTGIGELDRVLGGGLVPGSLVLLGGSPGIGKSTLTNMVLGNLAARRAPHAVRQRRGVRRAGQAARRAPRPGRAGGPDPRRDRSRRGARHARRARRPRGVRDRLRADAALRPSCPGAPGLGRAGARGRRADHGARQGARHRR